MAIHIYNYSVHAEQRYFLGREHRGGYDAISINGNIVAYSSKGVSSFVATANKQFFIDPQTHAFQHPTVHLKNKSTDENGLTKYEFKPSIRKLANHLGAQFDSVINNDSPIIPDIFVDSRGDVIEENVIEIVDRAVRFQNELLISELNAEDLEFLDSDVDLRPMFILAPYFVLTLRNWERWLSVNLELYKCTKQRYSDKRIFLKIVVSKDVLEDHANEICEQVNSVNPDGILLWIDELNEQEASRSLLQSYLLLLRNLKSQTSEIYNTHGGYFSTLLTHREVNLLQGVGHSINYGEYRPIVPVGGGIPRAWFYLPLLHTRVRYGDALGILLENNYLQSVDSFGTNVCKCLQCKELISKLGSIEKVFNAYGESSVSVQRRAGSFVRFEYPTKEAKQYAARHYLYNKQYEFENLNEVGIGERANELEETLNNVSSGTDPSYLRHLFKWKKCLDELT